MVTRPSDGKVFDVLGEDGCREILDHLLESAGPLTQKQLIERLGLKSSLISRRMAMIEEAGLVARESPHAPYALLFDEKVRVMLELGADLAKEIAAQAFEQAKAQAGKRRKSRMRGDGLLGGVEEGR